MKRHFLLGFAIASTILYSCQKESSELNTTGIQGTYKFKSVTAKTSTTATLGSSDRTVTKSEYTTTNNQGTLVIDDARLITTGLSYSLSTEAKYYVYQDNVLIDSSSMPVSYTSPATSSVAAYQLIGADSIYFPQGSLVSGIGGTGSAQAAPSGGRYTLVGNLLTIAYSGSSDSTINNSGQSIRLKSSVTGNLMFERQ